MASGKSDFYMSNNYIGSRRGRADGGEMGWEMFPEKLESTPIEELPYGSQLDTNWRNTLKDRTPDTDTLFAHEEARRNPYSRDFLNLRSGGARVNTDPYKNEDFDTQFHDHDPRGHSTEQPWKEYRRRAETLMREIDFKDDGDYSVPSSGISPFTMQKNIKGAFYWAKARMKWFDTAKDSFHNGGTGVHQHEHQSTVRYIDAEDPSSLTDPAYSEMEGRQHHTDRLSNVVNTGSKFIRANTTTDQTVKVASYGKLMGRRGLINHETQMRQIQDDTPWSKIEGLQSVPANLVALMSSGSKRESAAASVRKTKQAAKGDVEKYKAVSEQERQNRSRLLTTEVLSLLGFTKQEIDWLDSYEGVNKKHAALLKANLHKLTELVHATPAHVKLQMRDELIMQSSGGLMPGTSTGIRRMRDRTVINPKVVELMDQMLNKSTPKPGEPGSNRREAMGDPEEALNHLLADGKLLVKRSQMIEDIDFDSNRREGKREHGRNGPGRDYQTHSYANLAMTAQNVQGNRHGGKNDQEMKDTVERMLGKAMEMTKMRNADVNTTAIDNDFGENLTKDRRGGHMGSKYMMRHMDREDENDNLEGIAEVAMGGRSSSSRGQMM